MILEINEPDKEWDNPRNFKKLYLAGLQKSASL